MSKPVEGSCRTLDLGIAPLNPFAAPRKPRPYVWLAVTSPVLRFDRPLTRETLMSTGPLQCRLGHSAVGKRLRTVRKLGAASDPESRFQGRNEADSHPGRYLKSRNALVHGQSAPVRGGGLGEEPWGHQTGRSSEPWEASGNTTGLWSRPPTRPERLWEEPTAAEPYADGGLGR